MSALIRQAEEILEVAVRGRDETSAEMAIVMGRDGCLRIIDGAEWGIAGLFAQYGAKAVYRVERRAGKVRVEGWSGMERCVLDREMPRRSYATRSQVAPLRLEESKECSPPRMRNSYQSM